MKKILACLDLKEGRVVKGENFVNLKDAGDPLRLLETYQAEGASELVLLDISSGEGRRESLKLIRDFSEKKERPMIFGGGIKKLEDIQELLELGINRVSIGSGAVENPNFLQEALGQFGAERIILSLDVSWNFSRAGWEIYLAGARENTGLDLFAFLEEMRGYGLENLLLTSIDADGKNSGYDLKLLGAVSEKFPFRLIASGGAGSYEDFYEVLQIENVESALAASVFHFQKIGLGSLRSYLKKRGVDLV